MLNIAVCEDQWEESNQICELIRRYQVKCPHLQIRTEQFEGPDELIAAVQKGSKYHLFILDILMPQMNGISLARALSSIEDHPAIIFITSSPDFAVEAFSVRAVDYLLKPIGENSVHQALDRAVDALGNRIDTYAVIRTAGADQQVKISEIICVEVMGHSLCYYLTDNNKMVSKVLRISFEEATKDLMNDMRFIRPHRSFLINSAFVKNFSKTELLMENGMRIPISRLRFPDVKKEYLAYLDKFEDGLGVY